MMMSNNINYVLKIKTLLFIMIIFLPCSKTIALSDNQSPFCGIYTIYAAKKILGGDAVLKDFYKPKYVSSVKGSTIEDLKSAASDSGLYIKPIRNLAIEDVIMALPNPTILHVKANSLSVKYNHYVLFIDVKDGKAQIFDPPKKISLESFADLESRWDRVGLIVSTKPIDIKPLLFRSKILLTSYAALSLFCCMVYHLLFRLIRKSKFYQSLAGNNFAFKSGISVFQAVVIMVTVFIGSVMYNFLIPSGLISPGSRVVEGIQKAYAGSFIPKVSTRDIGNFIGSDTLIIDARYESDYKAGHIERAINIPVNLSTKEIAEIMDKYPKDIEMVIYCQSAGCSFAQKVTLKLKDIGYENICIYKGGYNEWIKSQNKL